MKNKKISLLLIIFCCFFVTRVKADMGVPLQLPIDVLYTYGSDMTLDNAICFAKTENACDYYTGSYVLKVGTKIRYDQYTYDNINIEGYGEILITGIDQKTGKEFQYELRDKILLSNVMFTVVEESYPLSKALHFKEKQELWIVSSTGAELYSGPSIAYKKIATVKSGTKLECEYGAFEDSRSVNGVLWTYVNYNGVKGWISTEAAWGKNAKEVVDIAIKGNSKGYNLENSELLKYPSEGAETIGNVPAGVDVNILYYMGSTTFRTDQKWKYIEYNGKKGWISTVATYINESRKEDHPYYMYNNSDITSDITNKIENIKIPSNTELTLIYAFNNSYYTEYNGIKGWVSPFDRSIWYEGSEIENKTEEEILEKIDKEILEERNEELFDTEVEEVVKEPKIKKNTTKNKLLVISITVVLVCASAMVILAFINEKNKKKDIKKEKDNNIQDDKLSDDFENKELEKTIIVEKSSLSEQQKEDNN